jgi:hypothetical protein
VHQLIEAERRAKKEEKGRGKTHGTLPDVLEQDGQLVAGMRGGEFKKTNAPSDKPGAISEDDEPSVREQAENIVHSRLLTKRQLSDMTWGVRELSKKLGNIRLKIKVKSVFLLTKVHDEELITKTREVVQWLLSKDRDTPYIVYVLTLQHGLTVARVFLLMLPQIRAGSAGEE